MDLASNKCGTHGLLLSLISLRYNPLMIDNRHLILLMGDAGVAGMYHEVAPLHCFTFTPLDPPSNPPTHTTLVLRLGAE